MGRLFVLLVVPLALLAASCGGGGGSSVSKDDAAVVAGTPVTRVELDRKMCQAKAGYDLQKRAFPKAGSQEYQSVQSQVLQELVQRTELAQEGQKLGVSVTDKQLETQMKLLKKQNYGGSEKKYEKDIGRYCFTDAEVRDAVRSNLLANAIYKKVTGGVQVSDADAKAYYDTHPQVYTQPQSRVVRHILVKSKALADKLYAQLKGGADFAALAKKYSQDPGSKTQGGRLTISKGQTVPQFDHVAFALQTGALSKPVHTQFGWHIIQALTAVKPAKVTPLASVKSQISQQLLQTKRTAAMTTWLNGVKKDYASKISYATGLAPATTSTPGTTTG